MYEIVVLLTYISFCKIIFACYTDVYKYKITCMQGVASSSLATPTMRIRGLQRVL